MSEVNGNTATAPRERKSRECLGTERGQARGPAPTRTAPSREAGRQKVDRKPAPKVISTKKGTITNGQKTAMWTMIRKNGLDEDTFRDWLRREFNTASTKELSMAEAAEVIHHLKVFLGEEYEPHFAGMTWGITGPQMRNIKRLAGDLGWDDPKRLAGMVKKMFPPKSRLELLNKREATGLIIALEKMGTSPPAPKAAP